MRYLFNDKNASFDETSKKYKFHLLGRLREPTELTIENVEYVASTGQDIPSTVLLRSETLSNLILGKHVVIVKHNTDNHDHETDILAVLQETHEVGRFRLSQVLKFKVDANYSATNIDIYFTDGSGRVLEGKAQISTTEYVVETANSGFHIPKPNMADIITVIGCKALSRLLAGTMLQYMPNNIQDSVVIFDHIVRNQQNKGLGRFMRDDKSPGWRY